MKALGDKLRGDKELVKGIFTNMPTESKLTAEMARNVLGIADELIRDDEFMLELIAGNVFGTLVVQEVYHDEIIGEIDDVYETYQLTGEEMDKVYGILLSTMNTKLEMTDKPVWFEVYVSDDMDMSLGRRSGSLEGTRLAELAEMFHM